MTNRFQNIFAYGVQWAHMVPKTKRSSLAAMPEEKKVLKIALRLADWSSWARDIARGVQHFAHGQPNWKLHVAGGDPDPRTGRHNLIVFDGLLTHMFADTAGIRRLVRFGKTKVVGFSSSIPVTLKNLPRVKVDDHKVAESIGRHLLAGGFRRLAFYGIQRYSDQFENSRWDAVRAFAEKHDCPCVAFEPGSAALAASVHLPSVTRWIRKLPKPVGIIAWNVGIARVIAEACRRAEFAVPQDVAIVSWDDDAMIAEAVEPAISAAVLPAERLGFEAARLLDMLLAGQEPKSPVLIEPSGLIHIRASSDVSDLENRDLLLAMQFIREHATDPIRVSDVAAAVRMSRRKLESEFQRKLTSTPRKAIAAVRLERAKQFLLETDWPTSVVARRSGFGTEPTLRAAFALEERMTPGQYRTRFGQPGN